MTGVRQLGLFTQWQLRRQAQLIPLLVVVQVFLAITTILGYGLLIGEPDPQTALYLATGAPTVTLVMVGLVMTPQMLASAKTEGSLDWLRTLPVPRAVFLAGDLLVWTILALPGTVLGVAAGALRFDLTLSVAPWIVPAALLVALTSAAVGYGMASVLPPQLAMLMSQVLVFVVLLFSPVSYPADRMPDWLATVHQWLPVEPMAQLMRAGLAQDSFDMPARSLVVLLVWCAASVAAALAALRRRA